MPSLSDVSTTTSLAKQTPGTSCWKPAQTTRSARPGESAIACSSARSSPSPATRNHTSGSCASRSASARKRSTRLIGTRRAMIVTTRASRGIPSCARSASRRAPRVAASAWKRLRSKPRRMTSICSARSHAEADEVVAHLLGHRDEPRRAPRQEALDPQEQRVLPGGEVAAQRMAVERVHDDARPAAAAGERGEAPQRAGLRRVGVHEVRAKAAQRAHEVQEGEHVAQPDLPPHPRDAQRHDAELAGELRPSTPRGRPRCRG